MVLETPSLYRSLTLPYLDGEKFDHSWIYNVLEHRKEAETIVYEDPDREDGFVQLPDSKVKPKNCGASNAKLDFTFQL